MSKKGCICCQGKMKIHYSRWLFICDSCGYQYGDLDEKINSKNLHGRINEEERESGLRSLREDNFRSIVSILSSFVENQRRKLLEVGSAHGWFLRIASDKFDVTGVEPDFNVLDKSDITGLNVVRGYFPDSLADSDSFDFIVFNDVFEHIKDLDEALISVKKHLKKDGFLVINIPSSSGFFYKISRVLAYCGYAKFFERMWQFGFPSPHIHYFNPYNLTRFLEKNGFSIMHKSDLESIRLDGLYDRIAHVDRANKLKTLCIYFFVILSIPIIRAFPSDAFLLVAKSN